MKPWRRPSWIEAEAIVIAAIMAFGVITALVR